MDYLYYNLRWKFASTVFSNIAIDVVVAKFKLKIQTSFDINYTRIWSGPAIHSAAKNSICSHMSNHEGLLLKGKSLNISYISTLHKQRKSYDFLLKSIA